MTLLTQLEWLAVELRGIKMPRKTFKKIITSEEISEKISQKNRSLINKFLKEKDRKCSDKTIIGYASDLEIFFTWNYLYNEDKYFPEVRKLEMSDFFSYCVSDLKWGSARFGRMKSLISGLSDFIVKYYDEDYPTYRNFIKDTIDSLPKVAAREKTVLKEYEVDGLLAWLKDENRVQEACFLSLAINCGARISELIQFRTDLIDYNNTAFDNMFLETTEQIRTKGFGKDGHKMYKFVIKDAFTPYYDKWLKDRDFEMDKHGVDHNYIFINTLGKPATVQTINEWIRRWEKYLEKDIYMHSFRHYFVTHLTRLGLTSDFIIEIMGWKSGDMYKIYNDLTAKDRKWKDTDILKKALESEDD